VAADDPKQGARTDWVPIPDPTTLTTEQLSRELSGLREILTTRLDAMDRAAVLLNENVTRVPTDTDKQISHLKELHEERFSSIQQQFVERDVRTEQAASANKIAIDAAFLAQKAAADAVNESNAAAITKSEIAAKEKIDGLAALFRSSFDSIGVQIGALTSRLDRGEGASRGSTETRTEHRLDGTFILGVVMAVVGVIAVVASVITALMTSHPIAVLPHGL
jgi:hypothetical protein